MVKIMGITFIAILVVTSNLYGDDWVAFSDALYISSNGKYEAYVQNKTVEVFARGIDHCKLLWQAVIPQDPRSAYISNDGKYFVLIDKWERNDKDTLGFVLYGNGQLISNYTIQDILGEDIQKLYKEDKISVSKSSIWWYDEQSNFDTTNKYFVLVFKKEDKAVFHLPSGKRMSRDVIPDRLRKSVDVDIQIILDACEKDENLNKLDDFTIEPNGVQEKVGHIILRHPEKEVCFDLHVKHKADALLPTRRITIKAKQKKLSTVFDPDLFISENTIVAEDIVQLCKRHPEITGYLYDNCSAYFDYNLSGYKFHTSINCTLENGKTRWLYYTPEQALKFAKLLIDNNFYGVDIGDYYKKYGIPIEHSWENNKDLYLHLYNNRLIKYYVDSDKIVLDR